MRKRNPLVRRDSVSASNRLTLRCSDMTLKCIGGFVLYLNIIERSSQLRVLLEGINGQSDESLIFPLALAWQLQNVRFLCRTELCSCNN